MALHPWPKGLPIVAIHTAGSTEGEGADEPLTHLHMRGALFGSTLGLDANAKQHAPLCIMTEQSESDDASWREGHVAQSTVGNAVLANRSGRVRLSVSVVAKQVDGPLRPHDLDRGDQRSSQGPDMTCSKERLLDGR